MNISDLETICETVTEVMTRIITSAIIVLVLIGIYLLIESPSKDERMADKGYAYVYSRRGNTGTYIPANSTEFKEAIMEMIK